jgi:hypothetical protein
MSLPWTCKRNACVHGLALIRILAQQSVYKWRKPGPETIMPTSEPNTRHRSCFSQYCGMKDSGDEGGP